MVNTAAPPAERDTIAGDPSEHDGYYRSVCRKKVRNEGNSRKGDKRGKIRIILLDIGILIFKLHDLLNLKGVRLNGARMDSKTLVPKQDREKQKWYLIDAEGEVLGRLATKVATLLRGKDSPLFTPHLDMGAFVVVINAEKIALTGRKLLLKKYYSYSGYPGGLKETSVQSMLQKHPERVVEKAVKGMLPHNRLGRRINKKLFVYTGKDHPHKSQKPETISVQ